MSTHPRLKRHSRLKRKLLRQAVDDNLALLAGGPPRRHRAERRLRALRRLALVLVPVLALGASTYVLSIALAAPEELLPDAVERRVVVTQILQPEADAAGEIAPEPQVDPGLLTAEQLAQLPAPGSIEPSVLRLGVQRIVLDPGHGGPNVGTVAPGGIMEKEVTLDVARRLKPLLEEAAYEVVMTREDDRAMPLEDRTLLAKDQGADLFVSIHVNWIEARQIRGVETYYLGATEDPYLNALAASENANSGYSLTDFRSLLEGVYAGVRSSESRRLAQSIQRHLYRSLKRINPQLRDRGVKTAPFVVLVTSEMPAVLVEVSCLSNDEEALLLAKPYYRQYIAEALSAGIAHYAESLAPSEQALSEQASRDASLRTEERL